MDVVKAEMKPGKRTHGPASLRLSYNVNVPAHLRAGLLEITHVLTPAAERGKGYASILMERVCAEADAAGKLLLLNPKPFDVPALDAEQLADWYMGFGFLVLQDHPVRLMCRAAGAERLVKVKPLAYAMGMH